MGFAQALSGLNGASKALEAIGNNIANGGTVGFKSSSAQFSDVYATSLTGGGSSQVGIGVSVSKVAQQFSQGNITTSGNPLDIAINGGGMFRLDTNGTISYTRTGQFLLDKAGFIVNGGGKNLTGYAADPVTGVIVPGNYVPLQMNNAPIPPVATTSSEIQTNLDARALAPAAMTHGATAGGIAPSPIPLTITTGVDDTFDITVDGLGPYTVTLPAATYQTVGDIATALTLAINTKLSATSMAVDVTGNTAGQLVVSSRSVGSFGSQGNGSTVVLGPTFDPADGVTVINTGYEILFGGLPGRDAALVDSASTYDPTAVGNGLANPPVATSGVDNFSSTDTNSFTASTAQTIYDSLGNPHTLSLYFVKTGQPGSWQMYSTIDNIAAPAPGAVTGSSVLGAVPSTLTIVAGTNDQFDIDVDGGGPATVTIPDLGAAYANPTALVNAINTAFNNSTAVDIASGNNINIKATARLDSFGKLIVESNTVNVGSSVVITDTAGITGSTKTAIFGALPSSVAGGPAKVDTLLFKPDGSLVTTSPVTESFSLTTGATSPLIFAVDLAGSTQYGIGFGVNQLLQDGYTSGKISGLSISADGVVQGNYSNGKSRNLGQLVLATFTNPNGLQSMGGNQWVETAASGQPIPGTPGSGSLGTVQSGAVEESNVDLTAELVSMITQQRAYQASAQTIKTIDQVLQTLVNLR
ncbi:MAG: flagellar hook protein FlgE [Rhodocyclaceae bacterium]|nr:MAG: flagellar hook protein FlgE [Rhodocyclaceae bacterium]